MGGPPTVSACRMTIHDGAQPRRPAPQHPQGTPFKGGAYAVAFGQSRVKDRADKRGDHDEAGRGLFLVDQLAWRWGARRLGTGKVVWFEQKFP